MANEKNTMGELLFNGAANFPKKYHDNEYYIKEVDEENKRQMDYLNSIAPDFIEKNDLIPKKKA